MACAVPCVSTDVVGVGKEILAAEAGFLFPYIAPELDDEQRYREAIDYILFLTESEQERSAIGIRAAKHAMDVFAPELITEQYLALFDS
jgi:glycosyltransferase involved in cell wall biosynthesis